MAWVQTESPSFTARHDEADDAAAVEVLELLEGTRERLGQAFARLPDHVDVVLHSAAIELYLAQPYLPALRALTAPAGRRYLAGWISAREIHVLTPAQLERRASSVPGSREMMMLAPAALYAQLVVGHNNRGLPPPFRPRTVRASVAWPWLSAGAGQFFSGQTGYVRPAVARRLREGSRPAFPPGVRDAALLGGTVFDLLARERGLNAAVSLACRPPHGDARRAVEHAFGGGSAIHVEGAWRAHLSQLAGSS